MSLGLEHVGQASCAISKCNAVVDSSVEENAGKTKKVARLLTVEHQFLRALQSYAAGDMEGGKSDINAQISSLKPGWRLESQ